MTIKILLPKSWNELSKKQFEGIVFLLSKETNLFIRDKKIFKILVAAKWWQFVLKSRVRYVLRQVPMSELREFFPFVFKENDRTRFEPKIKIGLCTYHAPMDRLINLRAEEFSVADDLHLRFRQTKDVVCLRYLFHLLYCETPYRPVFDKLSLDRRVNSKIPLKTLLATEIVYFGCKNHLVNKYTKVFPKTGGNSDVKKQGFAKIIQGMAKGDLSKLEKVEQTNLYKFLDQLQDDIEAIQQQKINKL